MPNDTPQKPLFDPTLLNVPEDWKDRASWRFDSFVMHSHTDICLNCSATMHYSNVFRMFCRHFPAATDRRLLPATAVPPELSVVLVKMPERQVPLCPHCLSESRTTDTKILVSSEAQWNEAVRQSRLAAQQSREERKRSGGSSPSDTRSAFDILGF